MSAARFFAVWAGASVASFGAILWGSGGQVLAPQPSFEAPSQEEEPSSPAALVSGSGKDEMGFAPTGHLLVQQFVDEKLRGKRALLSFQLRSPAWSVELLESEHGGEPLRRNLLREPVLELYSLKKDAEGRATEAFLQVRITAAAGAVEMRSANLAELDPEFPVRLERARIELDRQGDGVFEMQLDAREVTCTVDTTDEGDVGVPLREVLATGDREDPVVCVFGGDLRASATTWRWVPEADPEAPSNFVFGAGLRADMTSRRERALAVRETRAILVAPDGGSLRVEPPHVDAAGLGWREARFTMSEAFRIDQTLLRTDRAAEQTWIEGRDAWLDLLIASEGEREDAVARDAGEEPAAGEDPESHARLVTARVNEALRAGGGFGELAARAATFGFAQDEENRVRSAECEGPVAFRPPESSDWISKLFGEEGAGAIQGTLELRCTQGATLQRPDDLEPTRDGHLIELREDVALGVIGGPEVLRAGRWLRTRFEEPPAAILAQRTESAGDAPKLEPRWMEADGAVRLDHQGQIADGGHLRVDFEGWGEEAKRHLVLTEAPKVRVQMNPERPPLDLSCTGPLELSLGPAGLERAELSGAVRVDPITPDPAQLHLRCAHLVVAGVGEKELSFTARGGVEYDEGDRHVRCAQLERAPSGRISVVGTPAEVAIVHDGEPVKLRALWIGYDEALGSFYALGLAQRVELEPPASLARFDLTGSARQEAEPREKRAKGEKAEKRAPRETGESSTTSAPQEPAIPEPPAEPVRIAAHIFAAKLLEERTQVLGLFRVRVEGGVEARADWLWARKERTAQLVLGAFGARRIALSREEPAERVHGTARRMVWGEKDQDLRLLGAPRVRWAGTREQGFDIAPGLSEEPGGEQTYALSARESMLFTQRLVDLRGRASVRRVDGKPFELGGERIELQRNLADGEPRRLRLLHDARLLLPADELGLPPLLEVQAPQIEWDAATKVLHIRGDRRTGKRAQFSFQGQPDTAWYVEIDVERFVLKKVQRT